MGCINVRPVVMFVTAIAVIVVTTACSPQSEGKPLMSTPDEVTVEASALYGLVRDVLGEEGWETHSQWFACDAAADVEGVELHMDAQLDAKRSEGLESLANQVKQAWEEHGVDATVSIDRKLSPVRYILSDPPYLTGTRSDGSLRQLWLSEDFASFGYTSPCVPGDIFQLQPNRGSTTSPTVTPPSLP